MIIRVILTLLLFFSSSTLAVNKAQLIADVQYLLSAEPTIDYNDPKLNKILNKYNYRLFKTYKAFIEFDKSKKTQTDLLKAKKALENLSSYPKWHWKDYWQHNKLNKENLICRFFKLLAHYHIADDMLDVLPDERIIWDIRPYKDENYQSKYFKIPLWLALKYPDNLRFTNGFRVLIVNAKKSVRNIDEFNKFFSLIGDVHSGFWSNDFGEERFDSYLMTKHFIDVISFDPDIYIKIDLPSGPCAKQSIEERFLIFRKWSYRSEKNMLIYKQFLLSFDKTSEAIEDYYKNNYNLGQYVPYVKDILSHYICDNTNYLKDM